MGPIQPFGRLCHFWDKSEASTKHSLAANATPGLFLGWKIEFGCRYRGVLLVLDYDKAYKRNFRWNEAVKSVPESECHFPAEIDYPFRNKLELDIKTMANSSLPSPASLKIDIPLPFGKSTSPSVGPGPASSGKDSSLLPDVVPGIRFQINQKRMMDYGPTEGCAACDRACNMEYGRGDHTEKCRKRFQALLEDAGQIPRSSSGPGGHTGSGGSGGSASSSGPGGHTGSGGSASASSTSIPEDIVDNALDILADAQGEVGESPESGEALTKVFGSVAGQTASQRLVQALNENLDLSDADFQWWSDTKPSNPVPMTTPGASAQTASTPGPEARGHPASGSGGYDQDGDLEIGGSLPSNTPPCSNIPPVFAKKTDPTKGKGLIFWMEDYCNDAIKLYKDVAGVSKLRKVPTPFFSPGALAPLDDDEKGALAGNACQLLMKALWLARLSRPDIQECIGILSTILPSGLKMMTNDFIVSFVIWRVLKACSFVARSKTLRKISNLFSFVMPILQGISRLLGLLLVVS